MYLPTDFRESRLPVLHALMSAHPLATLVAVTADGIVANHIPLLLEAGAEHGALRGHIARANALWKQLADGAEVLAVFHGPEHYISPRWYPSKREHGQVVPTWNYAVVHARGALTWHHDEVWLRGLLEALTNRHESRFAEPWQVSDAPPEYLRKMLGAIVGFDIQLRELTGKWKASQNRSAADVQGVIAGLAALDDPPARAMQALVEGRRREIP
ncbi:MAG: FMN-binding negative transcriptional regulator [Steroidobacteraceae bacterium]